MLPLNQIFTRTRSYVNPEAWDRFQAWTEEASEDPADVTELMDHFPFSTEDPPFLSDLARLEWAIYQAEGSAEEPDPDDWIVHPSLHLLLMNFKNLPAWLEASSEKAEPERGEERVLVWRDRKIGKTRVRTAGGEDLLALKIVAEGISPEAAGAAGEISTAAVEGLLERSVSEGFLCAPRSRIRRDPSRYSGSRIIDSEFLEASAFTLQWHVTQACDLHCKHCYDRSHRSPLTLEQGTAILDDLQRFCRIKHVQGHISFSGGNPLLYPHFGELYRAAAQRGFGTAILGNPTTRERLEFLRAIQDPGFFQVSLEGLRDHNDFIRGEGHFDRVMEFLPVLKDLGIYSMVMLTLTKDNLGEVIPLAEWLRDRADRFFFNRLSQVGEGTHLAVPDRGEYAAFLADYLEAATDNPVMGLKDNLTNILHYQKGLPVFGGCTGFGCGAAFNFLTVLPDGEVHACRKLPSRIGNVLENSLLKIYDSEAARCYRGGTEACGTCPIRPVCGGCLAVGYGMGLNIFQDRDPYCFLNG